MKISLKLPELCKLLLIAASFWGKFKLNKGEKEGPVKWELSANDLE